MTDFSNATIGHISVHHTGNKTTEGTLVVSKSPLELDDKDLLSYLRRNFLAPFSSSELFTLTSANDDPKVNPVFQFVSSAFTSARSFHPASVNIARHLFDVAAHPNIKAGDVFVVSFKNILLDGEETEAIGVFKCESKSDVINVHFSKSNESSITHQVGLSLEKIDKACLIYNVDRDGGYRVSVVDKSSKSDDARYWTELFLKVKPLNNNYTLTRHALEMARNFVTDVMPDEFDTARTEQIAMLNKSAKFFKEKEEYNVKEFESEILEDPAVIRSFRKFKFEFQAQRDTTIDDSFELEAGAVKRYARVFKSVLKLDKNFHVYIHGDRTMIERGVERDGRKYYKIYYREEA